MSAVSGYTIKVIQQRIEVKAWGEFDFDLAQQLYKELKQKASSICDQDWVELIDFSKWQLATAECFDLVEPFYYWAKQNNLCKRVIVIPPGQVKGVVQEVVKKLSPIPTFYFDTYQAAMSTLYIPEFTATEMASGF
ncbi:hypothetical protein N7931_07190 [Catenovulum sp. 2E275]|uniref:hypothetical protein n=1 Tax=Catenovulum sp. 2E275 TaxID=2980497 RepID=UPI0021D1D6A1|nr:hypothetical protein [Catenovulum sp. 2E275]MCU4675416.1 hypothetical protein [Catenovulum sp. 2E275]